MICYIHNTKVNNGTMWDNSEMQWYRAPGAGTYGYVRDDGHFQPTANILMRRAMMKRLYTMGWLAGKPPLYFSKAFHQAPFATITRAIEGEFYIFSEAGTFFDQFSEDLVTFRTFGCSSNIPFRYDPHWESRNSGNPQEHHAMRSVLAVGVLHDHAVNGRFDYKFHDSIVRMLDAEVGFLNKERQAKFLPYWDNGGGMRFAQQDTSGHHQFVKPKGLFASGYISQIKQGKAVIWLVNSTSVEARVGLWLDPKKTLGKVVPELSLRDMETGEKLTQGPVAERAAPESSNLWQNVTIPAKDFRALVLE